MRESVEGWANFGLFPQSQTKEEKKQKKGKEQNLSSSLSRYGLNDIFFLKANTREMKEKKTHYSFRSGIQKKVLYYRNLFVVSADF